MWFEEGKKEEDLNSHNEKTACLFAEEFLPRVQRAWIRNTRDNRLIHLFLEAFQKIDFHSRRSLDQRIRKRGGGGVCMSSEKKSKCNICFLFSSLPSNNFLRTSFLFNFLNLPAPSAFRLSLSRFRLPFPLFTAKEAQTIPPLFPFCQPCFSSSPLFVSFRTGQSSTRQKPLFDERFNILRMTQVERGDSSVI